MTWEWVILILGGLTGLCVLVGLGMAGEKEDWRIQMAKLQSDMSHWYHRIGSLENQISGRVGTTAFDGLSERVKRLEEKSAKPGR